MRQLNQHILTGLRDPSLIPSKEIFNLPERVLQFGTGVLLRGLPDYFIDKANRQGIFNGRIVVIKSTSTGDASAFAAQDNLYTLAVRGIEGDLEQEEVMVNSSISRVLSAGHEWGSILHCAADPLIQLVISNTTESGIVYVEENIHDSPPSSFPCKLLAILYKRFQVFNGSVESGLVIIPTELIPGNASLLKKIILELAVYNKLEENFIQWVQEANDFCNSLVDRIVPGAIAGESKSALTSKLGYDDELMIMAETFRFWAIETSSPRVREVCSFASVDEGIVLAPSINRFSELKLRILNGTHSFSCAVAILAGFTTVREAMENGMFRAYMERLMFTEIAPATSSPEISMKEASAFAGKVIDRFRNPFIEHKWASIGVNYPSKIALRSLPLISIYINRNGIMPEMMAFSVAAYALFMDERGTDSFLKELAESNKLPSLFVDKVLLIISSIRDKGIQALLQQLTEEKTTV